MGTTSLRILPALALALALAGCSSATAPTTTLWEGTLTPAGVGGVSGVVAAVAQAGRTQISVEIRQGVPGETYGWRVSEGSCQDEGSLLGGAALYPPLVPGPARTAGAEAAVPGQLEPGGSYAARVVRSEGGAVVACGALARSP